MSRTISHNGNFYDLPNSTLCMDGSNPVIGITTLQQITTNSDCTLSKAIATITNYSFAYINTNKSQQVIDLLPYAKGIIVHYDIEDDDTNRSHSNAIKNMLIQKTHWRDYVVNGYDLPASSVYLSQEGVTCTGAIQELVNVANLYANVHNITIHVRAIATPLEPYDIYP